MWNKDSLPLLTSLQGFSVKLSFLTWLEATWNQPLPLVSTWFGRTLLFHLYTNILPNINKAFLIKFSLWVQSIQFKMVYDNTAEVFYKLYSCVTFPTPNCAVHDTNFTVKMFCTPKREEISICVYITWKETWIHQYPQWSKNPRKETNVSFESLLNHMLKVRQVSAWDLEIS